MVIPTRSASDWLDAGAQAAGRERWAEARSAYRVALDLDPALGAAWLGLGLAYMAERRFAEAVSPLERAVASPEAEPAWTACLGQALFLTGDFAGSVAAFETSAADEPLPDNAAACLAQARCLRDVILGDIDEGLQRYAAAAGLGADALAAFAEQISPVLIVFGFVEPAAELGRWRLARTTADPAQLYRQAVLEGETFEKAPADYVERHFDDFADRFDHQLVDMLSYAAPVELPALVATYRDRFDMIGDLGCGTGLAAEALKAMGARLVGVDLSGRMLEKAEERALYDELVKADVVAFMQGRPRTFDLLFAADMLIYLGDLGPFFAAAAKALKPGGLLAFTTERGDDSYALRATGRFAHADAYIDEITSARFHRLEGVGTSLRLEGAAPIAGAYHVLALRDRPAG